MDVETGLPHGWWQDERDGVFFRIVAGLFGSAFLTGAGVLLASFDIDDTGPVRRVGSPSTRPVRPGLAGAAGQGR